LLQFIAVIKVLLPNRARLSVISYKDYCDSTTCSHIGIDSSEQDLLRFISSLRADGGGDAPEATKTGFNEVIRMVDESIQKDGDISQSIIIHYTDAPPHHDQSDSTESNKRNEKAALQGKTPGYDWISICKHFQKNEIPIYTFLTEKSGKLAKVCMAFLSEVTLIRNTASYNVTKATIGMLMHVMGEDFKYNSDFDMLEVEEKKNMGQIMDETRAGGFPLISQCHLDERVPFHFKLLGNIRNLFNVNEIMLKFKQDETFSDTGEFHDQVDA
jgi:hypothetical protein